MSQTAARRRYYLHSRLKNVVRLEARSKTIHSTQDQYQQLATKQKLHIWELQGRFGYQLQLAASLRPIWRLLVPLQEYLDAGYHPIPGAKLALLAGKINVEYSLKKLHGRWVVINERYPQEHLDPAGFKIEVEVSPS